MQTNVAVSLRCAGLAVLLCAAACGDDDDGAAAVPATAKLSSLDGAQLSALCKELLVKIKTANTPQHQCTLNAVISSESEAECKTASASCVSDKDYDDWTKAKCAETGKAPKFDCSTSVGDVHK